MNWDMHIGTASLALTGFVSCLPYDIIMSKTSNYKIGD